MNTKLQNIIKEADFFAKNIFFKKKSQFLSCSIMMESQRNDVTLGYRIFFYAGLLCFFMFVIVSFCESFKDANKLIQTTVIIASMDSWVHTPWVWVF